MNSTGRRTSVLISCSTQWLALCYLLVTGELRIPCLARPPQKCRHPIGHFLGFAFLIGKNARRPRVRSWAAESRSLLRSPLLATETRGPSDTGRFHFLTSLTILTI